MLQRLNHRAGHYALLLTVGAALFLVNLGGPSLWDVDEGRNATAAVEMLESGDFIVPTFNATLRSHKPVLLYWLQVAAYRVFGVNEFAARLPSALAALLALLLTYELGRRLFEATTGLLAALVLGSTALFCASAHFANPDALLNAFVVLTLFFFWRGYARSSRGWFIPAGAAAGLAFLTKGPTGLLLPGAVIVLFLTWSGRLRLLLDRRLLGGMLAFVLVGLPWYVWVGVETKGQFLREFFLTHNYERAVSVMEGHRGPPYYYLVVLLVGFAPWSVFLVLALWYAFWSTLLRPWAAFRGAWVHAAERHDEPAGTGQATAVEGYRFLVCWVVVYVGAFSVATTKLPNYILPLYAPAALLTARFLERWRRGELALARGLMGLCLVLLGLIGVGVTVGLLLVSGAVEAAFIRGRYVPGLEVWAAAGAAPVVGALAAAWCARRQRRSAAVVVVTLAALLLLMPLAAWGSAALNRHKAPRPLVEQAGALCRDRDIRIAAYQLEYLPSLNFYCQRNVTHLPEDDRAVRNVLQLPYPVYLFLPAELWDDLRARVGGKARIVARHRDMYHACEVVVVTNR
jgi:4-amino-4-deoxy-L-arabinose transferase-like glycosyltransferase